MIRPPIGEAFASNALERNVRALVVRVFAGIITEIELRRVAMQVGLAQVVIGADHAALEDGEEVFDRVGVEHAMTAIFAA